jgi:hypothetical protein
MTETEARYAEDFYRDKLVDWMIGQDIPTGNGPQDFDGMLEVIAAYITKLKKELADA